MDNDWKKRIRAELAGKIGQRVSMQELFARYMDDIPLHEASRLYASKYRRRKPRRAATPTVMRWVVFSQFIWFLNCERDPPTKEKVRAPMHTVLIPRTKPCEGCGVPFFSIVKARYHSPGCESRHRIRGPRGIRVGVHMPAAE